MGAIGAAIFGTAGFFGADWAVKRMGGNELVSRFRSRSQESVPGFREIPLRSGEVRPPWVEYPGVPPWDFFWREAGENWKTLTWEPHYNGLSKPEQEEYLKCWDVPQDWRKSYFDEARRHFWEHIDDPEE